MVPRLTTVTVILRQLALTALMLLVGRQEGQQQQQQQRPFNGL